MSDDKKVFWDFVQTLKTQKIKDKNTGQWVLKNPWALQKDDNWYNALYEKNKRTGLPFDGVHITVNQNGLSYDYIAYKNRLLLAYPETKISFSEVYADDEFSFSNNSDGVYFTHKITSPFSRDTKNIIGVYCVIKNKRGEFLTLLDKNEIAKHKAIAKTQTIWNHWELEMIYKTIIKKATRIHYEDVYSVMNDEDNIENDVESLPEKRQDKFAEIRKLLKDTNADEVAFFVKFGVKAVSELNFEQQDEAIRLLTLKLNKQKIEKQVVR